MKNLKRKLEPLREVVIEANSILLWEKSWYPGVIFGATTVIFLYDFFYLFLIFCFLQR